MASQQIVKVSVQVRESGEVTDVHSLTVGLGQSSTDVASFSVRIRDAVFGRLGPYKDSYKLGYAWGPVKFDSDVADILHYKYDVIMTVERLPGTRSEREKSTDPKGPEGRNGPPGPAEPETEPVDFMNAWPCFILYFGGVLLYSITKLVNPPHN